MTHGVISPAQTVIHKFGNNPKIDTATVPEDIWDGSLAYPFPAVAAAGTIVSDSGDDATGGTGAKTVRVMGVDANWADISEDIGLNGVTPVALANEYLRIYRAYVITVGTEETNAGNIAIAVGGTTIAQISAGQGQTLMAIFTTAAGETWQMLSWYAAISGKTAAKAEVALQTRTFGGAWRTKMLTQVSETSPLDYTFPVPFIIAPKTDIRVRVLDVAANDTEVSSTFGMVMI
jgi:hypothetical protein